MSFKFEVPCDDPYAIASGIAMNAFRPRCKCISGYKSNNPNGGTILRRKIDVCIRCLSVIECGDAPTISPTVSPTLSSEPSLRPSRSSNPSDSPSYTSAPSANPTTLKPTLTPTSSPEPSPSPTSSPTRINSVFDGDPCRFSIECKSRICSESMCIPENVSYHSQVT